MLSARGYAVLLLGLALALTTAAHLGSEWNARLVQHPVDGDLLAGQSVFQIGGNFGGDGGVYQKIVDLGSLRLSEYGFTNFNQDRLQLTYKIPTEQFQTYNAEYGYFPQDVQKLQQWRDNARQSAYRLAVKTGKNQEQLNAALSAIDGLYQSKLRDYLESRGFRLEAGNVTRIDMPQVVRRNAPLLKPIALVLDRVATEHRYQSMDIIGAGLSFVQTALRYRQPEDVWKGKHTGAFVPPLTSVVLGWGNCDSKSALLASILSNWAQMRMIGIFMPGNPVGHYVMGVLQIPDQGDVYVEYQGLKYVLTEPAGPAWLPPGRVGDDTLAKLNAPEGYKIDQFF
ncbi:MAG: hypothetical protein HKL90_11310 [Elusimicrobia bacterium]|nr:hypothetical protein [Elusimicrobiota bacterium]